MFQITVNLDESCRFENFIFCNKSKPKCYEKNYLIQKLWQVEQCVRYLSESNTIEYIFISTEISGGIYYILKLYEYLSLGGTVLWGPYENLESYRLFPTWGYDT